MMKRNEALIHATADLEITMSCHKTAILSDSIYTQPRIGECTDAGGRQVAARGRLGEERTGKWTPSPWVSFRTKNAPKLDY